MSESLSEFYIEKAKSELGETESRKQQSYEVMKKWILKHPFVKFKNPDILSMEFLLQYLRTRKYNMEKAFESFEKTLSTIKRKPNWFNFHSEGLQRALDLYETGYMIVTKERDSEGRRAIICSHKVDGSMFTADDIFRLTSLVVSFLCNEPQSQISGVIFIHNSQNVTLSYLALLTIKKYYEASVALKTTPVRMKKIIAVGMPIIAMQTFNIAKSALSEKLRKRIVLVSCMADLSKHTDVSILPKEYGGNFSAADLLDDFRPALIAHSEYITNYHRSYEVDFKKAHKCGNYVETDLTGSFRKLEVD